jgi:hypothetical protein
MDSAARYRSWLAAQGFEVEGMAQPVLIRRRQTALEGEAREKFTRDANVRTTASMSAAEQAKADAAALDAGLLAMVRSNDIDRGKQSAIRPEIPRKGGVGLRARPDGDAQGQLSLERPPAHPWRPSSSVLTAISRCRAAARGG